MVDRHDRLRHGRVAQHTSKRREKSQHASEAPGPFGRAKPSTFGAHAYPYAYPSSSSHMIQVSPTDASLPPSSRRRHVSPI